jgi:hypothetical protein
VINKRGETSIVFHLYKTKASIFESLIRQAIIKGVIHADKLDSEAMISRIFKPVLSDDNRNVIHHISSFHSTKLEKILTGFNFKKMIK